MTHLYDKCRERCYDSIEVVQFTPPLAGLSDSCLYNIFVGQLFRYQRIITDLDNYIDEVGLLVAKLVVLGYQEVRLRKKFKRHLHNHRYVFPSVGKRVELVAAVWEAYLLSLGELAQEEEELVEVQDIEGEQYGGGEDDMELVEVQA